LSFSKHFNNNIIQKDKKKNESSILLSQEGFAFWNRVLRKLEKARVVPHPLTSPPQKLARFLGVMPFLFLSMEIHSD
jgi:hypothetical protein